MNSGNDRTTLAETLTKHHTVDNVTKPIFPNAAQTNVYSINRDSGEVQQEKKSLSAGELEFHKEDKLETKSCKKDNECVPVCVCVNSNQSSQCTFVENRKEYPFRLFI